MRISRAGRVGASRKRKETGNARVWRDDWGREPRGGKLGGLELKGPGTEGPHDGWAGGAKGAFGEPPGRELRPGSCRTVDRCVGPVADGQVGREPSVNATRSRHRLHDLRWNYPVRTSPGASS